MLTRNPDRFMLSDAQLAEGLCVDYLWMLGAACSKFRLSKLCHGQDAGRWMWMSLNMVVLVRSAYIYFIFADPTSGQTSRTVSSLQSLGSVSYLIVLSFQNSTLIRWLQLSPVAGLQVAYDATSFTSIMFTSIQQKHKCWPDVANRAWAVKHKPEDLETRTVGASPDMSYNCVATSACPSLHQMSVGVPCPTAASGRRGQADHNLHMRTIISRREDIWKQAK